MRVLLLQDSINRTLAVMEITEIYYDDDITDVKEEDGSYDRYEVTPVTGIVMKDTDGDWLYIKDISKDTCDTICRQILTTGYADLSGYGEYEYDD